jgi:hypothetical protein
MLLLALAATNAAQGVVVCVGADGHVALEPVAHHHCTHEECESDVATLTVVSHADGHPHVACPRTCTDIPVCAEFSALQSTNGPTTAGLHPVPGPAGAPQLYSRCAAAYAFAQDLPSYTHSLRSVVLQV